MGPQAGGHRMGEGWLAQHFNSSCDPREGGLGGKVFLPEIEDLGKKNNFDTDLWNFGKILSVWGGFGGSGGKNKPQEVSMV